MEFSACFYMCKGKHIIIQEISVFYDDPNISQNQAGISHMLLTSG